MDCITPGVPKSRTGLNDSRFHFRQYLNEWLSYLTPHFPLLHILPNTFHRVTSCRLV